MIVKFKEVDILLNWYNMKKIPTIQECINYINTGKKIGFFGYANERAYKDRKKSAERWLSVLQTCEDEELDFIHEINIQLEYLNQAVVYSHPSRGAKNNQAALTLYYDRSQNARYLQYKKNRRQNLTFLVP